MMSPMAIILDEESRICFYHNPEKAMKYKIRLEEILQLAKDVQK